MQMHRLNSRDWVRKGGEFKYTKFLAQEVGKTQLVRKQVQTSIPTYVSYRFTVTQYMKLPMDDI